MNNDQEKQWRDDCRSLLSADLKDRGWSNFGEFTIEQMAYHSGYGDSFEDGYLAGRKAACNRESCLDWIDKNEMSLLVEMKNELDQQKAKKVKALEALELLRDKNLIGDYPENRAIEIIKEALS